MTRQKPKIIGQDRQQYEDMNLNMQIPKLNKLNNEL